jgi:hypothetical protein
LNKSREPRLDGWQEEDAKSALPLKERDFTFANFGGNEFFNSHACSH